MNPHNLVAEIERLRETRAALVETRAVAGTALELVEQIENGLRHGEATDEDAAVLRSALRDIGEALIDSAGGRPS